MENTIKYMNLTIYVKKGKIFFLTHEYSVNILSRKKDFRVKKYHRKIKQNV